MNKQLHRETTFNRGARNTRTRSKSERTKEEKLIDILMGKSFGRINEKTAKEIVNMLDCDKSYFVRILRSRVDVSDFLTEKKMKVYSNTQEGKTIKVKQIMESNLTVLGQTSFTQEEINIIDDKEMVIKQSAERVVQDTKTPFVVIKTQETYETDRATVGLQEVHVNRILGVYI